MSQIECCSAEELIKNCYLPGILLPTDDPTELENVDILNLCLFHPSFVSPEGYIRESLLEFDWSMSKGLMKSLDVDSFCVTATLYYPGYKEPPTVQIPIATSRTPSEADHVLENYAILRTTQFRHLVFGKISKIAQALSRGGVWIHPTSPSPLALLESI